MHSLALRIRQSRRSRALSQAALAARIGVARSAVAQWERANGSRPTTEHLEQIALETLTSYEWLATGRGAMALPSSDGDTPALLLDVYAHDELEERPLNGFRCMSYLERSRLVELLEALTRRTSGTIPLR